MMSSQGGRQGAFPPKCWAVKKLGLKSFHWGNCRAELKFLASIISSVGILQLSVGKLQLSVPATFLTDDVIDLTQLLTSSL